jgi:ornithine cyclodeaminase/alanine dehydrogenase-like protein (mu-crystallin family)
MKTITAEMVNHALPFPKLIKALQQAFTENIIVPPRLHFDIENPSASRETTLLMMPAWQAGDVAGIKLVTVAPDNHLHQLPSIQGTYLLFDVCKGSLKATMDAPSLTAKRTAAASALASQFLSKTDSETLLIIGTGTLAPQLIEAHASVRPIKKVYVWGRTLAKAERVCQQVKHLELECEAIENLKNHISQADIISCATLSTKPLIFGEWLRAGQHLDMVGAYRPDMREMDDQCLLRSQVFVDNMESALRETGDLAIPLKKKVITANHIKADLFSLCGNTYVFKRQATDITVFKSVGHALEDLTAAKVVAEYIRCNK